MAYQSKYNPINFHKYKGDSTRITARSNLERKFMRYLDLHKDVLEWNSEEVIVPYRSPIDNRVHRYFTDFWVKMIDESGATTILLVEVKPLVQCKEPARKSRVTRRYLTEVRNWGVNRAKWAAAKAYADSRGWRFVIITDKEINGISSL